MHTKSFRSTLLRPLLLLAVVATLLSGCANLAAVRDFASQAKSLSSYNVIPPDLVGTNVRRQALFGKEVTEENLANYKRHREHFEDRQAVIVKYMGALAAVADNEVINYKKNLDDVAGAATKADVLDKGDADLFASAANLVATLATDGARRKLVRDLVTRCDPAVQKLTAALAETVREDYLKSLRREADATDGLVRDADLAKNPGLSRLARYAMFEHTATIAARKKSAEAFAEALGKIGAGHAKLAAHIGDFTRKEFIAELKGYQDELKALQAQFKN